MTQPKTINEFLNRSRSLAAIDMGSNATRISIVHVDAQGLLEEDFSRRYPLRLASSAFSKGYADKNDVAAILDVYRDIAWHLKDRKVDRYRAIATSAMRTLRNRQALIDAVREETGIKIEVISGKEESSLARRALLAAVGTMPPKTLFVDLGGGSLEVSLDKVSTSLPLGNVRLLTLFPALAGVCSKSDLRDCMTHVVDAVHKACGKLTAERAFGIGGTLLILAEHAPEPDCEFPTISIEALAAMSKKLMGLSAEDRQKKFDVRADRADILLTATAVVLALAQHFELTTLTVPRTGIRQAMLQDLAAK